MVVNNGKPPILADCCSIYSGFAFKSEDLNAEGNGFPVIKIGEIQNGTVSEPTNSFFPEDLFVNKLQKYILKSGDTLIAMTGAGSVGRVGRMPTVTKPYLVNQRVAIVRPDEEVVHTKFIYYFLSQEFIERSLYDLGLGAGQPNISADDIGRTPIPLPPLPIQNKIAAILSAYDELIENNNRRIALLEKMAEEIYREWFVRMRFPGHEKTKFHKGIPEGWEVKKLGDVAEILMGQSPPSESYNENGVGLPFNQGVGTYGLRFPRKEVFCNSKGRIAKKGDILFSVRAPVGRLNIADCEMIIGRGLCAIKQRGNLQNHLWYLLKNVFSTEDIIGNGSIFSSVGRDELESVKFVDPSANIKALFNGRIQALDELISNLIQQNTLLKHTRDALLPRLMSGKLDVENLDIAFPPGMQN